MAPDASSAHRTLVKLVPYSLGLPFAVGVTMAPSLFVFVSVLSSLLGATHAAKEEFELIQRSV
jgi:hypothetical protein